MSPQPSPLIDPNDPLGAKARAIPAVMPTGVSVQAPSAPAPVSGIAKAEVPVPLSTPRAVQPVTPQSPNEAELSRIQQTGPGYSQVKNPFLRGLATAGSIASGFFPRIAPLIPGTEAHHGLELARAGKAVAGDTAQEEAQAREGLQRAQSTQASAAAQKDLRAPIPTNDYEGWQAQNPGKPIEDFLKLKKDNSPDRNTTPFDEWRKQNPQSPAEDWLKLEQGAKPTTAYEDFKKGYTAAHPEASPDQIVTEFSKAQQKTPQNEYEDFKTGYERTHPQADAFEIAREYARAHQAPQQAPQSMMLIPGADGKFTAQVIRPGSTVEPGAMTTAGVAANNSASVKGAQAAEQDMSYAKTYLSSGQFTGPKDEALLEAFFDIAKPSTGFRMSQQQIDLLRDSRSWMDSAKGAAYHAEHGVWFPPTQRQQIVDAMEARAESKGAHTGAGGATPPSRPKSVPENAQWNAGKRQWELP